MEDKVKLMKELVAKLNDAADAYYDGRGEVMTDYEWDAMFDELKRLELETGVVLEDSPTNKVSADHVPGEKEEHEFSALSLAKTKKPEELVKWADGREIWLSWKLDGLTLVVTYDNGHLTKVVTRGDGHVGTNITHLASAIRGIRRKVWCVCKWFHDEKNTNMLDDLLTMITVQEGLHQASGHLCQGLTFVVTGDVHHYKNRNELKAYIASQGGKVTGSVSKSTNYLINNDINSVSSKNQKAKQLGVEIIDEDTFIERFGNA